MHAGWKNKLLSYSFPVFVFKVTSIAVCVSRGDPVSIDLGDGELVISKELRNSEIEGKN